MKKRRSRARSGRARPVHPKTLQVTAFEFSKAELAQLGDERFSAFVTFGIIVNEVFTLRKLVLASDSTRGVTPPERNAQGAQTLSLIKLLALKVDEGWKFYSHQISKPWFSEFRPLLSQDADKAIGKLRDYFEEAPKESKKPSVVRDLRNFAGGHFSTGFTFKIEDLPTEFSASMYLSEQMGNSSFFLCEEVHFQGLMKRLYPSAERDMAFQAMVDEIHKTAVWLTTAIHGSIDSIAKAVWHRPPEKQREHSVLFRTLSQVSVPFFVNFEDT